MPCTALEWGHGPLMAALAGDQGSRPCQEELVGAFLSLDDLKQAPGEVIAKKFGTSFFAMGTQIGLTRSLCGHL